MDVVGWLRGLELEHAITGRTSSGEMLFDSEPERVAVPVLIVANTSDACPASPPGDAEDRRRALPSSAPRRRNKGGPKRRWAALHRRGSNGRFSGHQFRLRLMQYLRASPELAGQNQSDTTSGDDANCARSAHHH